MTTKPETTRTEHGVKITAEATHHDPAAVGVAQRAVARVCLENRADLELAVRFIERRTAYTDTSTALREILQALDDWHTASIEVMQDLDLTPEDVDNLMVK